MMDAPTPLHRRLVADYVECVFFDSVWFSAALKFAANQPHWTSTGLALTMHFRDLKEAQILALAITAEEEDARIYRDFAEALRADFPATAELFTRMAGEEDGHRRRLLESYRQRFGDHIPLIRRQDVKGFMTRRPS